MFAFLKCVFWHWTYAQSVFLHLFHQHVGPKAAMSNKMMSFKFVHVLWVCDGSKGGHDGHTESCVYECVCFVCFACMWVHLSEGECDGVSRQLRTETSVLSPLYKSNRKPQGSCHFATNVLSVREKEFISVFQSVCIQGSVACFPTQLLKRHCGKC